MSSWQYRGQTSVDMVIAIGVLTIGLSVAFLMTGGYFTGGVVDHSDTTPTADTVADELAMTFTHPGGANSAESRANLTAINGFFTGPDSSTADSVSVDPDTRGVNVTLRSTITGGSPLVFERITGVGNATRVTRGESPPIGAVVSEQALIIEGELVILEVRTWVEN